VSKHLCQGDGVAISTKIFLHFGKFGIGFLDFIFHPRREATCVRGREK
jgi:hypothetical protein